jgi:hypothetical protein
MENPLPEAAAPAPAAPAAPGGTSASAPRPGQKPIPRSKPFPWVAFIAVAVLAAGGWFIVSSMSDVGSIQDCVMSGKKNCAPLDPKLGR